MRKLHKLRTLLFNSNANVVRDLGGSDSFLYTMYRTVRGFAIHCINTSIYIAKIYYRVIILLLYNIYI